MKLSYTYSGKDEMINIPDDNLISIVKPPEFATKNQTEIVNEALKNPQNSVPIKQFLGVAGKLLIVVNDATRITPTSLVLSCLKPFITDHEVIFLVATGAHPSPSQKELRQIFGNHYHAWADKIIIHDARSNDHIDMGVTSRGTRVKFNRLLSWADRIININSLEPHYFAGFTGGRKSFLPGIAAYSSIEENHSLALDPDASLLKLSGNPVHLDMMEAAGMIRTPIFSLNLVLDGQNKIFSAFGGDLDKSFQKSVIIAEEIYLAQVTKKADIIIAFVKKPLSQNLYQSQKGIENCRAALAAGGILILISECAEGIGPDNFYRLLSSCNEPAEVFRRITSEYRLGYHKAAKLAGFLEKHHLWMITDIPAATLESIHIRKFTSAADALNAAFGKLGEKAGILVNPDAGAIVPRMVG